MLASSLTNENPVVPVSRWLAWQLNKPAMIMADSHSAQHSPNPALAVTVLATRSLALLAGLIWLAAAVFVWRRLAGALVEPLSLPGALGLALAIGITAFAARLAWHYSIESPWRRRLLDIGTSVAVLGMAAALSVPGTSPLDLALLWVILVAEESWTWRRGSHRGQPPQEPASALPPATATVAATTPAVPTVPLQPEHPATAIELPEWSKLPADTILQQFVRTAMPDGSERLTGWLRVPLLSGQRSANLHLAFCPPFAQTPRVTVDQRDGPTARIKAVQLLPYGARFDLKLAQPLAATSAVVLYVQAESATTASGEPGSGPQGSEEAG